MSVLTRVLARSAASPPAAGPSEHLSGFSSLLLLAGRGPHTRILYLLAWSRITIATTRSDGRSTTIAVDGWDRLPLAREAVDVVIADLDAAPDGASTRRAVSTEIGRVLKPEGRCIAAVTHRRRARDRREWTNYRLVPPLSRWREPLRGSGLARIEAARLEFDGPRITAVHLAPHTAQDGLPEGSADAVALVLAHEGSGSPTLVSDISAALGRELGAEAGIECIHVRKIGKTAAFVARGASRLVVRMPCSSVAMARARRNHAALEALHDSRSVADIPKRLVPEPLAHGEAGGRMYFVERLVPGVPREGRVDRMRWEPQALDLITKLHVSTARPELLSEVWFEQTVEPPLGRIESCVTGEERAAIARLRSTLRNGLIGRRLPLVRSHGDFTGSNCLYGPDGRLSGIVDWELSSASSLPLLDLVQLVDLPAEYTADERWHRAELAFDAVEGRGPLAAAPEIAAYTSALGLSDDLAAALLLTWWVDHAGARVEARGSDVRWFQRRVRAPLARFWRLAQDGRL